MLRNNASKITYRGILPAVALAIMMLFSINAGADSAVSNQLNMPYLYNQLVAISETLSQKVVDEGALFQTTRQIDALQPKIDNCVKTRETRLKKINQLMSNNITSAAFKPDSEPYLYLQKEKNTLITQEAYCNFFNYRLSEMRTAAQSLQRQTIPSILMVRTMPLWKALDPSLLSSIHINTKLLYKQSGLDALTTKHVIFAGILLLAGLILGTALCRMQVRWMASKRSTINLILSSIKKDLPIVLPVLFLALYLNTIFYSSPPMPMLLLLMNALLIYLFTLLIVRLSLQLGVLGVAAEKALPWFNSLILISAWLYSLINVNMIMRQEIVPPIFFELRYVFSIIVILRLTLALIQNGKKWLTKTFVHGFLSRADGLATVYLIGYISIILLHGQPLPERFFELRDTLYLTFFNLANLWLAWYVFSAIFPAYAKKSLLLTLGLFILTCTWCGYHNLALLFIPNLIITITMLTVTWEACHFLSEIYLRLNDPTQPTAKKLLAIFGKKPEDKFIEFFIIRIYINLPIILVLIVGLIGVWGQTRYHLANTLLIIGTGEHILNETIHPTRIFQAVALFCIINLLGRMIRTYVTNNIFINEEKHTRVMISALIQYFTFTLAFLAALFVSGVSLSGILVVTGALSVGLGFGLQHFASDFVSGLFLMANKPVKMGDHVIIDGTEGFVRKIGTLSTQLTTLTHSDVIIPNSNLIIKSLINFTFHNNRLCRLQIPITLQNNADAEEAKALLLAVAAQNPDVIQTPPNQPVVLFELNALRLWCVIKDVELQHLVTSALNFAIANACKEKNIVIVFPAV